MNFILSVVVAIVFSVLQPVGVATVYFASEVNQTGKEHAGQPLYCDRSDNFLSYRSGMPPWIAVDVSEYRSGSVRCGDTFWILLGNGRSVAVLALDAGHLYQYRTRLDPDLPILADFPEYDVPFDGTEFVLLFINASAQEREER